jgi:dienelactone hydrolase
MIQWRQDLARTIDYLQTRPEIDSEKLGYIGESFGGMAALPLLYLENRLKVAALMSGGLPTTELPPEIDPVNYVPRTKIPLLLVSSRHDSLLPVETAQKPLMALLGTDPANKRHVFLEGGHTQLPRGQTIKEMLAWLDRYQGPVK